VPELSYPTVEPVETSVSTAADMLLPQRGGAGHASAMPFTYMLKCSDGSYYVGSTWNLERRLFEHNCGVGARYTARRRPVLLVWSQEFARIDEAFALEKRIQNWSRAKRLALIEGRLADLPALSRGRGAD
jgi:predicted GIY-YIG superfamily endonuclease